MSIKLTIMVAVHLILLLFAPKIVLAAPPWPNTCGDGRVDMILEDFDAITDIRVFKADPSIPEPDLRIVPGCHGQALSFGYDLNNTSGDGQSWIVLQWSIPITDLAKFTHIRLALRGSNLNSHENVEVKLRDDKALYAVTLKSMTDLPVWRPIYIDLRELTNEGTINLAAVSSFEIAVARCFAPDCEVPDTPGSPTPNDHAGTLFLDEFAFVDLKSGAPNRLVETAFERVEPNPPVAEMAATALYRMASSSGPAAGLVPAWFPEQNPNYNTYAQAEALLVFIYEHTRSGDVKYRDAARNLAQKLLHLQIPAGKTNAGAWYTSYDQNLQPPSRPLPDREEDRQLQCNGNEAVVNNVDGCEWVGNVGWVLIALGKLQQSGLYDDPVALREAIDRGAGWVIRQIGYDNAYPDLISYGIEGNIAAYFGLLALDKEQQAGQLGKAITKHGWDPVQRRMKPGIGPADVATAMDVSGSWGVTFLRSMGMTQEALDTQGYAATVLRTSSFDNSIVGYGDIAGPFTVAIEFTAQAAVAGIKDANFVMRQLYPLQITDAPFAGAFPGATDHWYGGALPAWNTTMAGVSPTAWVYFAASGIDPLWETLLQPRAYLPLIMK